ncbi:hypothetical protein RhiXN_08133 [Rhizoctonia solani]|uniref:Uncharacterized protein n=1 Tax=Rhizoctonia solani TaxID=456999 RepID=A0A8H8SZZ1_9AGAM|nr:uncharacterized protein RhiXN_08133 [Rhizoctonia solani]QRW23097.1 hypothetical protein RhiXN_08133 [Rhizoctonia solani]
MSDPSPGNNHHQHQYRLQGAMIGPTPTGYRPQTRQPQPAPGEMEAFYQAYLGQDIPSSTVPSAPHSQSQHPPTLDTANFGVFEPQPASARPFPTFSSITSERPGPQPHQQQIPGDFIPGGGAGTNEWYQQQRNNSMISNNSGSSAAQLSSPVRDATGQHNFSYIGSNSNAGNNFTSPTRPSRYPNDYSSGSDFPSTSEQYNSPQAVGSMSPDKHFMSSPEQMHYTHSAQPMYSAASQAPLFAGQAFTMGQAQPFAQPSSSPTRPQAMPQQNSSPIRMTAQQGAGYDWRPVDSGLTPSGGPGGSAGSHSSGGGTNGGGAYATSSQSANSSGNQVRPPQHAIRQPGSGLGRSHSMSSRPTHHRPTKSASGHLVPPNPAKRPRPEEPEEEESEGDDDPQQSMPSGRHHRSPQSKRL